MNARRVHKVKVGVTATGTLSDAFADAAVAANFFAAYVYFLSIVEYVVSKYVSYHIANDVQAFERRACIMH